MNTSSTTFPWYQGKQRRPYAGHFEALVAVSGQPDGVIYERKRGEKLKTSIVCGGRGVRWQVATTPYRGYLESILLDEGVILSLTHMYSRSPLIITKSRDSLVCAGVVVDGTTLSSSALNRSAVNAGRSNSASNYAESNHVESNHAESNMVFVGATHDAALPGFKLPTNKYVSSVTLLMPYRHAVSLIDPALSTLHGAVKQCVEGAQETGSALDSHSAPANLLRFTHDVLHCSYQGVVRYQYMKAKYTELLCHLNESLAWPATASGFTQADREALITAHDELLSNVRQPYSVDELSAKAGLSKEKLSAGLKHLYGKGFNELLLDARMELAQQELLDTESSIESIAASVGYCSASSFIRAFKSSYGVTPKKFRSL